MVYPTFAELTLHSRCVVVTKPWNEYPYISYDWNTYPKTKNTYTNIMLYNNVSSFGYFICLINADTSMMLYIAARNVSLTERPLPDIPTLTQLTVRLLPSTFPIIRRYRKLSTTKRNSWVNQRFLVCQHTRRLWCINPLMNPLKNHRRIVTHYFICPRNIFNCGIQYVIAVERIYYCLLFV